MQSVGNLIQATRLQAGISLEEISVRTRISLRTLQAIEADDVSVMPSAFFYKSFISQFASALQIENSTILPLIEGVISEFPEPLVPGQNERIAKNALIRSSIRPRNFKWLYSVGSLFLVLICCSGFYAFWESKGSNSNGKTGTDAETTRAPQDGSSPRPDENPASLPPSNSGDVSRNQGWSGNLPEGFRVELSALEPTWLSITADGRQTFRGMLKTEQKKSIEGHEQGRIRTGNAGGISFVFNGKPIGVVGPRGQVRTVVFTRDNYEIIQPPAGAALSSVIPSFGWMKPLLSADR